ncbi:MAG: acyl-CoA synthetase [Nocardioidaceae bacterium]
MNFAQHPLLRITDARVADLEFSWDHIWGLFDGGRERMNIAHECIDRHPPDTIAARIAFADGRFDEVTFGELSRESSRFAHHVDGLGVRPGEPVGVMMDPSREFYAALFGIIKTGAVAVPLYTLFGPDALRDRLQDCGASVVVTDADTEASAAALDVRRVLYDARLERRLAKLPATYVPATASDDTAVLQYTSGTTRQLPEAVRHEHRSVVTLARSALYATGVRPGDRFFCPSSPAWGHGLWHGTIGPWSLGVAVGAWSGRFDVDVFADALLRFEITNLSAASTIYRMVLRAGRTDALAALTKASYTGEELGADAHEALRTALDVPVCGIYGTTETGVIIVNFPGFTDHVPKPGALGKPMPGCRVTVLDDAGEPTPVGTTGEIAVHRRGAWLRAKDLGSIDEDGFLHYAGRADDVIISSGWTISPLEVERTLLSHPDVSEVAVVGVPDPIRGRVVKAFVIATTDVGEALARTLQELVKRELSPHEYPRELEFVDELPKTPSGKINHRVLRDRAAST